MKILVAIESDKNAEQLAHTTLRWAARAGFDLRVFVPDNRQSKKYKKFLDEYNYYYWGSIDEERAIVAKQKPTEYANGFANQVLALVMYIGNAYPANAQMHFIWVPIAIELDVQAAVWSL